MQSNRHLANVLDCTRAIRRHPESMLAYFNRGVSYYALGRFEEAELDFTLALELKPLHGDALLNRGATRLVLRRYAEACSDYSTLIACGMHLHAALVSRALVNRAQDKVGEVFADLVRAWQIDAMAANVLTLFTEIFHQLNSRKSVLAYIQRLPVDEQQLVLRACVDAKTPLGRFFAKKFGVVDYVFGNDVLREIKALLQTLSRPQQAPLVAVAEAGDRIVRQCGVVARP